MPHAALPLSSGGCQHRHTAHPQAPPAWPATRQLAHVVRQRARKLASSQVRADSSKQAQIPAITPAPETATWDPEGLLSSTPASGGHFARRERSRTSPDKQPHSRPDPAYPPPGSSNALKSQLRSTVTHIDKSHVQNGGIPAAQQNLYDQQALARGLTQDYLPVNLQQPGVRMQCLEPPVLTIDNFMTADECKQLADAAQATGLMKQSKIGEGNAESGAVSVNERRTSSSVLIEPSVVQQHPDLQPMVLQLQAKAQQLLDVGSWTTPGQLPPPGQFCFESLQVACYQPGQHFLEHEDAFPPNFVWENRFQRQATLLVYLNSVQSGGATHFGRLNVSIQPEIGKALLFFPAFSDGTPDPRTIHTAQSPETVKWVTQVWIAGGNPRAAPSQLAAPSRSVSSSSAAKSEAMDDGDLEARIFSSRRKKGGKGKPAKGKAPSKAKKGFA